MPSKNHHTHNIQYFLKAKIRRAIHQPTMNQLAVSTYLSDVKPHKYQWTVQTKILHTWKVYEGTSGESLEMVLADQKGTKIHASCKKSLVVKHQRHLTIGRWTIIENFKVDQAKGQYRVTLHPYKINFQGNTKVTPSASVSEDVYLSLVDFSNIIVGELNPFVMIDVMGQIVNAGVLENVEAHNKPTKKIEFELRNTEDVRLPCTLWGRFAEQVYSACQTANGQIVVCLIRFGKLSTFRDTNQITNAYDASVVMINPPYPEVENFRTNLPNDGLALAISDSKPKMDMVVKSKAYWAQFPKRTIACLYDMAEVQKCKIICTVVAIDADMGWFYIGCKKCSKKVEESRRVADKRFLAQKKKLAWWCPKCRLNVTQVVPRYKLHVKLMDHTSETNCVFFDNSAGEIVGQKAVDLIDGEYDDESLQDPENLPLAIRNLVGKTFQLLFCIEDDNISHGNDTYRIGKMWSGSDIDAIEEIEYSEAVNSPSRNQSGSQEMFLLTNGPDGEALSGSDIATPSSTPSSKRSSDDAVVDMSSTTKKICLKSVKIEKGAEQKITKVEKGVEEKPKGDPNGGKGKESEYAGY